MERRTKPGIAGGTGDLMDLICCSTEARCFSIDAGHRRTNALGLLGVNVLHQKNREPPHSRSSIGQVAENVYAAACRVRR